MNNNTLYAISDLHTKPFCAHIYEKLVDSKTAILREEAANPANFHGINVIKKAVLFIGGTLNLIAATVSWVAALTLVLLNATVHCLTGGYSKLIQNSLVHHIANAIHNHRLIKFQAKFLFENELLPSHVINFYNNYGMHRQSILRSQGYGQWFNQYAGRPDEPLHQVISRHDWSTDIKDYITAIMIDIYPQNRTRLTSAVDLAFILTRLSPPRFEDMPQAEEHLATLQEYSIARLNDPTYMAKINEMWLKWLTFILTTAIARCRESRGVQDPDDANTLILHSLANLDDKYQKELQTLVQEACNEVYHNPQLVACLAPEKDKKDPQILINDVCKELYQNSQLMACLAQEESTETGNDLAANGRNALKKQFSKLSIQIANFTQLKELEQNTIAFPVNFKTDSPENIPKRKEQVEAARLSLKALPKDEREKLALQLLKNSDVSAEENTYKLYHEIRDLASSLHEGSLKILVNLTCHELDHPPEPTEQSIDDPVELGRNALKELDSNVYVPLANFTQLKELEQKTIVCPNTFGAIELQNINKRKEKIDEASLLLDALTTEEKEMLAIRLLKGSDFVVEEKIHKLYLAVAELAGSLHQGKLMCQLVVFRNNNDSSGQNLFHLAFQKALEEIRNFN